MFDIGVKNRQNLTQRSQILIPTATLRQDARRKVSKHKILVIPSVPE